MQTSVRCEGEAATFCAGVFALCEMPMLSLWLQARSLGLQDAVTIAQRQVQARKADLLRRMQQAGSQGDQKALERLMVCSKGLGIESQIASARVAAAHTQAQLARRLEHASVHGSGQEFEDIAQVSTNCPNIACVHMVRPACRPSCVHICVDVCSQCVQQHPRCIAGSSQCVH
jgi:hypothetical protein